MVIYSLEKFSFENFVGNLPLAGIKLQGSWINLCAAR